MILPTKRLSANKALLVIGAEVLALLEQPATVSQLWREFKSARTSRGPQGGISYDWFILSLDFLFIIGAIELSKGRLKKVVTP